MAHNKMCNTALSTLTSPARFLDIKPCIAFMFKKKQNRIICFKSYFIGILFLIAIKLCVF